MAWYSGDGSSDDGSWASAEGGNGEASASGGKRSYSEVAASALTKSLFQDISQAEWDRILEEDLERQHDALVDDLAGNLDSETLSLVGGVEAVRNELEAADWDEAAAFNRLVLLISGGDDDDDDGEAAAGPSSDTPVDGPVPDGVGDGSAAAAASPGNVELGVQVEWVEQGAAVTVAWACDDAYVAANTGTIGNDWIAFMPAGTEFSRLRDYSLWNWVTDGASTGTMTFTAPKAVGSYTFTYFRNKTYEVMATSPEVTVGPHYAVTAHQVAGGGTRIRVVVDQVFGADHPYAWVGLFADADASTALAMERLSNADADGAVFVNAPTAGEYEVRCFPYQYVAVSKANVTVVGDDAVELTHVIRGDGTNASDHRAVAKITMLSHNPATDRVWVGLYRVGEENNRKTHGGFTMRRYAYVTETVFEIDWKLPIHEGEYEARVFRNSSYDDADLLLRSAPIAGAALATIPAPTEEEGETTGGAVADALVGADE